MLALTLVLVEEHLDFERLGSCYLIFCEVFLEGIRVAKGVERFIFCLA